MLIGGDSQLPVDIRRRIVPRVPAAVLAAALGLLAWAVLPERPRAQGIETTCHLTLVRFDASTANSLYMDDAAIYWGTGFHAVPGWRIRITGTFPQSRYMSWNVYDAQFRPVESSLADVQIEPDAGSINPFRPRARRSGANTYTVFVEFGPPPADPAPNTIYAGVGADGRPNADGSIVYRIYLPDPGRGSTGGVPLPRVVLEPREAGRTLPSPDCTEFGLPSDTAVQNEFAAAGDPATAGAAGAPWPGRNPPRWKKWVNFGWGARDFLLDNFYGDPAPHEQLPGNEGPGIIENKDIAYVYAPLSKGFGRTLMLRARAPTFADTGGSPRRMPARRQLRYFSFCAYEAASQRVVGCLTDHELPIARKRRLTIVVSAPDARPPNARRACGVGWLPWGPQPYGLLIYRQMLARPSFRRSVHAIPERGQERQRMRAYYPRGTYLQDPDAFRAPRGGRKCRPTLEPRMRLRVRPRRVRAGGRKRRFAFRLTAGSGAAIRPVGRATVAFVGRRTRTGRRGRAVLAVRLRRPGRYRARASKRGLRPAVTVVRATRMRVRRR